MVAKYGRTVLVHLSKIEKFILLGMASILNLKSDIVSFVQLYYFKIIPSDN